MLRYLLKRLLLVLPTVLGIVIGVFLIVRLIPGDPAQVMVGERASPERIAEARRVLGLDQPLPVQLVRFAARLAQGDLGVSFFSQRRVLDELLDRYPATIELAVAAMLIATTVGVAAGVLSAVFRNSPLDFGTMTAALAGVSMPVFWLGYVLLYVFSVKLHWLPGPGRLDSRLFWEGSTRFIVFESLLRGQWDVFVDALRHLALPALALATIPLSVLARITRSSVLEVLSADYIRTARAKGLRERTVIFRHALRNALLPVLTIVGLEVGYLLGGAVLTETVFAWPGVGRFLVDAIFARDYPVVQGVTLTIALVFVVVNLAVDVLYAVADPRIRYD